MGHLLYIRGGVGPQIFKKGIEDWCDRAKKEFSVKLGGL